MSVVANSAGNFVVTSFFIIISANWGKDGQQTLHDAITRKSVQDLGSRSNLTAAVAERRA